MENWENKIIADKLNSLEGLPEGYSPNIASKWEIIQSGLQGKKGFFADKRWLGAFLFFVLIAVTFLLIDFSTTTKDEKPNRQALIVKSNKPSVINGFEQPVLPAMPHEKKKINKLLTSRDALEKKKGMFTDTVHFIPSALPPVLPFDSTNIIRKDTVRSFPPIVFLQPKSKPRLYQKDFDGIVGSIDSSRGKTAQKGLHLKFSSRYNKNISQDQPPALRLTQNF